MTTDEEKSKICKLLQSVEVPEIKLTERCSSLVKEFHKRYDKDIEEEMKQDDVQNEVFENPYRADERLLEENERKLRELLAETKRVKKQVLDSVTTLTTQDPKRPWRTHTSKEKLLRIEGELKRHLEKSSQFIHPLGEDEMQDLIKECRDESRLSPSIGLNRLRDTVIAAKKNLPNFQYKKIENSTATAIMSEAHVFDSKNDQSSVFLKTE
ncbi:unnamed protein product [Arctia plantaginis]|uniref:Uncharacterized protein n=1 Tax=Arctia plantaginis TaxID=874455 RepID=A0A8S0YZJ5_ARCPL|nr:unnamed protein product [Arctia plantaginis]CAB3235120.1 unnamed protein product [Arctia plantaginis]